MDAVCDPAGLTVLNNWRMHLKHLLRLVVICASVVLVGQLVALDQEKLRRLVTAMQLPAGERERRLAIECTNRLCAYDPVAEVVALIEGETRVSCLYIYPGSGQPWNCRTNWGQVCLSFVFGYAVESNMIKFERIDYLGYDATEGSMFVLKEKGTKNRWVYSFRVFEGGKCSYGLSPFEERKHGKSRSREEKRRR